MLSLNRIKRMKQRIAPYVDSTYKNAPKKEQNKIKTLLEEFESIRKKTSLVIAGIVLAYILIYISIVSAFLGELILVKILYQTASIIGTTIVIVILGILHWYMGILRSDAHTIVSQIIALGSKYIK